MENLKNVKSILDKTILELKIQPVGNGYIDLIVRKENINNFINILNRLDIKIEGITWWCLVESENNTCPQGMGGPKNRYGEGYYSEIPMDEIISFPIIDATEENNKQYADYIFITSPKDDNFVQSYTPAFWLTVPDDWQNQCG